MSPISATKTAASTGPTPRIAWMAVIADVVGEGGGGLALEHGDLGVEWPMNPRRLSTRWR